MNEVPGAQQRISVIIATYNSQETLSTCLESVERQSYPNKEIIVVDGASTDDTVNILRAHDDELSYWESGPDSGVYQAWNKALRKATGEWVHFLGSDDYYTAPDVLERMAQRLQEVDEKTGLVYGRLARVTPTGHVIEVLGDDWPSCKRKLPGRMTIPHGAAFHRRALFEAYGLFDEGFRIAGDYEFMLRALREHEALFVDDIVVIAQRCDGMSSQPETAFTRNAEMARARRLNGETAYSLLWLGMLAENFAYAVTHRLLGPSGAVFFQNTYRRISGRPTLPYPKKERR